MAATTETLRYIDFYAGVGGWTMALEMAVTRLGSSLALQCCAAIDHSDLCLAVYQQNHPGSPTMQRPIEDLTIHHFVEWNADLWMMSPPCQPHTRQHDKSDDVGDPRSKSFLYLCSILTQLPPATLPKAILLENVDGFQTSESCRRFLSAVEGCGYQTSHFLLQPTQVGLPNDRPRYYNVSLRVKRDSPPSCYLQSPSEAVKLRTAIPEIGVESSELAAESTDSKRQKTESELKLPPIGDFLNTKPEPALTVPRQLLEGDAGWCFDIVTKDSRRSSCFTSGYGRFIRGTGSILYTGDKTFDLQEPADRTFDSNWAADLNLNQLRYFSGMELSRLFGFASDFSFPPSTSMKQQWKLMGNSLNVRVASRLVELALQLTVLDRNP